MSDNFAIDRFGAIDLSHRLGVGGIYTIIGVITVEPEVTAIANCAMVVLLSAGKGRFFY